MKHKEMYFLALILVLVAVLGFFLLGNNTLSKTIASCNKEENCCIKNEDCGYAWFTGRCNTPEYVSKRMRVAEEKGLHLGEAPPRENVTCTCENNKCVTHG
jgi:hypothetical protein